LLVKEVQGVDNISWETGTGNRKGRQGQEETETFQIVSGEFVFCMM